jgi:hypothetical protein
MRYRVRQWSRILGRWDYIGPPFMFACNAEAYARQEHGGHWTQVIDDMIPGVDNVLFDTNAARLT